MSLRSGTRPTVPTEQTESLSAKERQSSNARFDVVDDFGQAQQVTVEELEGDFFRIHFIGWNSRHDEKWDKAKLQRRIPDYVIESDMTCDVCGEHGELLLCNGCKKGFHSKCLESPPPASQSKWYCGDSTGHESHPGRAPRPRSGRSLRRRA